MASSPARRPVPRRSWLPSVARVGRGPLEMGRERSGPPERKSLAARSATDHRDDPRRLRRGQVAQARLRRGRAAAGFREGSGRFREPRRHHGRAHAAQGARAHPAGLRLPRRGRRRDQGRRPQPLDRRSARRHHELPARRAAFRDLHRARARRRDRRRRDLPADLRRAVLGREGQRRLHRHAQRPLAPAARLGPQGAGARAGRHRHPASRQGRSRRSMCASWKR